MKLFIILKDSYLVKKSTKITLKKIKFVLNFLIHLEYGKVSSF